MRYINAYEVTQGYGGPEEGGWWYDIGEPLASVPIDEKANAEVVIHRLKKQLAHLDTDRPRTSAAGDGVDVLIWEQDHVARPYPERKPHYE